MPGDGDGSQGPSLYMATTAQLPPPSNFSFRSEEWQRWSTRWERYRQGSGLISQPEKT